MKEKTYRCPKCGGEDFYELWEHIEESQDFNFSDGGEVIYGDIETFMNGAYVDHTACDCGHIFTHHGKDIRSAEELKEHMEKGTLDND